MVKYLLILFLVVPSFSYAGNLSNEELKSKLADKIDVYIKIFENGNFDGKESLFCNKCFLEQSRFDEVWKIIKDDVFPKIGLKTFRYIKNQVPMYMYNKDREVVSAYFKIPKEINISKRFELTVYDGNWYLF